MGKTTAHIRYKSQMGIKVPGVTTILNLLAKPALVPWANKLGLQGIDTNKYVDELADIGTLAHYFIMCHLTKQTPETSDYSQSQIDRAENCFLSYLEWEKHHKVEPNMTEAALVSEEFLFGGMVDFYGLVDGLYTLMDFKTGRAIYDEYWYQVAAYRALLEEQLYRVDRVIILRIGRDEDEGFDERNRVNLSVEWKIFLACLEIYKLKKLRGKD